MTLRPTPVLGLGTVISTDGTTHTPLMRHLPDAWWQCGCTCPDGLGVFKVDVQNWASGLERLRGFSGSSKWWTISAPGYLERRSPFQEEAPLIAQVFWMRGLTFEIIRQTVSPVQSHTHCKSLQQIMLVALLYVYIKQWTFTQASLCVSSGICEGSVFIHLCEGTKCCLDSSHQKSNLSSVFI